MSQKVRDFLSLTRMPFAFTQTLFIILGFLSASGADYFRLLLGVLALGPTLIYGGIYTLNDLADREYDRKHPKKEHRAVASGRINDRTALALSITLIAFGLAVALYIGRAFALICLLVLLNNLLYSFKPRLKSNLYSGLASCSLNYPLRFLAGVSIASTGSIAWLPAILFYSIALNGFSAYRIYDARSGAKRPDEKQLKDEISLMVINRTTAATAAVVTLVMGYGRMPLTSICVAAYMLLFSEINLRIVKKGVDFFQLLRVRKTMREKPKMVYYPAMVALLAVLVVCVTLHYPLIS